MTFGQSLATFYDMSKKTIVEFSRYPVAFVAMFAQIFLIITMFTLSAFAFVAPGSAGKEVATRFAGYALYGLILNFFLSFMLWEVGFSLREEQIRGTLESLYLSPASKFSNLISRIFAITIFTGMGSALAFATFTLLVGNLPAENLLLALAVMLLAMFQFLGFGFLFAAVTLRLKETAQLLVNFFSFFFMIFSAMFFPFQALRDAGAGFIVDYISRWLPVSYAVDLFRSLLIKPDGTPELASLEVEFLIVALAAIVMPIVGYLSYRWAERSAREKGTISEF
jgi:ABC-2 type transport system permease protein